MPWIPIVAALASLAIVLTLVVFTIRTAHWGATAQERAASMPGDACFGETPHHVTMTRAISIEALPEAVWPWLAQCGRGAGWYSVDRLDNGGRRSARHLVSWIPAPRLGDATAVGYLRHITDGEGLTWWVPGLRFLGAWTRLAVDVRVRPDGGGSRLVIRCSADARGRLARPAPWVFRFIDGVMSRSQLLGIRRRIEERAARPAADVDPETGARDQYQLYEVIYASGERAGVPEKEQAARWRRAAIEDGVLVADVPAPTASPKAPNAARRAEGALS